MIRRGMDEAKERVMALMELMDEAKRRRLVFLASLLAQSCNAAPQSSANG